MAVEVEGCRKGGEVNPRSSIILGIVKAVRLSAFNVTILQNWREAITGRPFTCQSAEIVFNYCFPLLPHLKGSLIHMFLIHLHLTCHNVILRESGEFQSFFHFLVLPLNIPPPSLRGPGLFLWLAINHLHSKGCSWIPCSQLRIFLWVCSLANTGSFIPIKWKSKHIFCRNPTPIDPLLLPAALLQPSDW